MSAREDEKMQDRGEQEAIDDLLDLDRRLTVRAANERIAGGLHARIAWAYAEHRLVVGRRWRWGLSAAAAACLALIVIWFAEPGKHWPDVSSGNTQNPRTASAAAALPEHVDPPPSARNAPGKKVARPASRKQWLMAQESVPHQATFPLNVAPTDQEVLLMQLASQQPNELLAVAKAIADMNDRDDRERRDFEQWVQKGEKQ